MIPANQYIFTNLPSPAIVRGGRAADAMCLTHEHLMFINEAVRTLEHAGSLVPRRSGLAFTGSVARNAPGAMAMSRTMLEDYYARANAVSSANIIDWGSVVDDDNWLRSSGDSATPTAPVFSVANVRSRLRYMSGESISRPSGMAAPRSIAYPFLTAWYGGVIRQIGRVTRHDEFVFTETGGLGSMNEFFRYRAQGWTCNGSASVAPESSTELAVTPFFYAANGGAPGTLGMASAYFREVSDKSDLTFALEGDYGYEFPAIPWIPDSSHSQHEASFSFVFGMMQTAIWKNAAGQYAYDKLRTFAFSSAINQFALRGNGSTAWGLLAGYLPNYTVKRMMEDRLAWACSGSRRSPWAVNVATEPAAGMPETFSHVGYQLYMWPAAVIVECSSASRDMGEVII